MVVVVVVVFLYFVVIWLITISDDRCFVLVCAAVCAQDRLLLMRMIMIDKM